MGSVPKSDRRLGATAFLRLAAFSTLLAGAVMLVGAAIAAEGAPTSQPQRPSPAGVAQTSVQCSCDVDPTTCPSHGNPVPKQPRAIAQQKTPVLIRQVSAASPVLSRRYGQGNSKPQPAQAAAETRVPSDIDPKTYPCHGTGQPPTYPPAIPQQKKPVLAGDDRAGSPALVLPRTDGQANARPQQAKAPAAGVNVQAAHGNDGTPRPPSTTPQQITITVVLDGDAGAASPVQVVARSEAQANVGPQPAQAPSQAQIAATIAAKLNDHAPKPPSTMPRRLTPLPAAEDGAVPLAAFQQPLRLSVPTEDAELGPEKKDADREEKDSGKEESGGNSPRAAGEPPTLGEAPEEPRLQFLRQQSILLDPGQYEIDITLQYSNDQADFTTAEVRNNVLVLGEARRRQRLLVAPLEFRLGLSPVCQTFINVPFGWSSSEFSFAGVDEFGNSVGIGDVSAGIIRQLVDGDEHCPSVLATFAFSAPTGESQLVTALATPGSALGEGFFTLSAGLTFIQTYDPVVVFYGFGYRHRFDNTFEGGFDVEPGQQFYYRFGVGFAINPRVTVSTTFIGSYIEEDTINGVRLAGGIREPMQLRLGATINKQAKKGECHGGAKNVEPFLAFGLTEEAVDSVFGVSWTY